MDRTKSVQLRRLLCLALVALCGIVGCLPLFHRGFYMGHDWSFELTRVADYAAALKTGPWPVRWSTNLEGGYGSPIYLYFPPFPLLLFCLPILFGAPLIASMKVALLLLAIVGGCGMFLFSSRYFGDWGGLISGCLYALAPYHFVDLFTRNALAEFTALCIAPLVFNALAGIVEGGRPSPRRMLLLIASGLAFLLSHVLSLIMYLPLVLLFLLVNGRQIGRRTLTDLALVATVTIGLAAFFFLPLLVELGNVQTWQLTVGKFAVIKNFVTLQSLLDPKEFYSVTPFSAILLLAVLLIGACRWGQVSLRQRRNIYLFAGYLILCLVMMTEHSRWLWSHSSILQKFQFPWRLLSPATFSLCFLCGLLGSGMEMRRPLSAALVGVFVGLAAAALLVRMFSVGGEFVRIAAISPEEIRSQGMRATVLDEYLPVWVHEYPRPDRSGRLQLDDAGEVTRIRGDRPAGWIYLVKDQGESNATLQRFFFPGLKIRVDGREIPFTIDRAGLPRFRLTAGAHQVEVRFENTWDRILGNAISLLTLLFLLGSLFRGYISERRSSPSSARVSEANGQACG